MRFVRTRIYRKKFFWVQPPCYTHESHWYFVILQIEANIFVLSPITRRLELNDLLIESYRGQIGQKGQKGHLFSPVFFPLGARGDLACKSCASSQETSHD